MALPVYSFATTARHGKLTNMLYYSYLSQYNDDYLFKTHYPFGENTALAYEGTRKVPSLISLIDAKEHAVFPEKDFSTVEPDFMLFRENKFLLNKRETRVLGKPDLIIEVWSEGNDDNEIGFKHKLYSTSLETEHWYILQDSNIVDCYIGEEQIKSQSLTKPLISSRNLVFDLTRLALEE